MGGFKLAPINPKSGAGSTSKSGTGLGKMQSTFGKSSSSYGKSDKSSGKSGGSSLMPKINKSSMPTLGGKSSVGSSSVGKSYPSFTPPKSSKPSVSLGIIWIPTRKNKKKEAVYKPHNNKYDYSDKSPSMYKFMSGDSPDYDLYKKKEEEANLLVPERSKAPLAIASAEVAATAIDGPTPDKPEEEKQEFLKFEKDETKDGSGDTKEKEDKDDDYLEDKDVEKKSENKWDKDKFGDNVDSVYLRPPPPHKARSTTSSVEEKDCCIECLYYTLQCCDCVLM